MPRVRRLAAVVALAFVAVVAVAGPAAAHAELVSTTPSSGQVLERPPDAVIVRFDQRVQLGAGVQLHDARGRRVDDGRVRRTDDGRSLRLEVGDLERGGYVVTWRVLSADGHPVSGGITFRVGRGSQDVDQGLLQELLDEEGGDTAVAAAAAVARALLFVALLLLVGGVVFVVAIWPGGLADVRFRATLRAGAAVAGLATVAGLGLQGADVAGLGLGHAFLASTAWDAVDSQYGHMAVARLVLLGVLALLLARPRTRDAWWQLGALAAGAGSLATITYAGHARTGRWLALSAPLDLVHLGAAAVWLGGLVVLFFLVLPADDEGALRISERFSRLAWWAVVVVVATGTVQGVRQVAGIDGLRDTNYGRLLVVKVVVVAILVAVAGMSRSLLHRREQASLRRAVGAETALAVVVLAVTSLLVAADPSRVEQARSYDQSVVVQGTIIEVIAAPATRGPVDIHLYVQDQSIGLTTPLELTATIELPDRDIPPIEVPIRNAGARHWSAYDVDVPIAGSWRLTAELRIGRFESRTATFTLPIS